MTDVEVNEDGDQVFSRTGPLGCLIQASARATRETMARQRDNVSFSSSCSVGSATVVGLMRTKSETAASEGKRKKKRKKFNMMPRVSLRSSKKAGRLRNDEMFGESVGYLSESIIEDTDEEEAKKKKADRKLRRTLSLESIKMCQANAERRTPEVEEEQSVERKPSEGSRSVRGFTTAPMSSTPRNTSSASMYELPQGRGYD